MGNEFNCGRRNQSQNDDQLNRPPQGPLQRPTQRPQPVALPRTLPEDYKNSSAPAAPPPIIKLTEA